MIKKNEPPKIKDLTNNEYQNSYQFKMQNYWYIKRNRQLCSRLEVVSKKM